MIWTSPDPLQGGAPTGSWVSPDPLVGVGRPRTAQGFWDNVAAHWQASSLGLAVRGQGPEVFSNTELPWYQRLGGSLVGLAADIPAMAVGGFVGGAIPSPGPIKGITSGAGAFVAPAVIREALMQHYATGETDWTKLAVVAGKEAVVGGATFWAGGAVSRMLPELGASLSTTQRVLQGAGQQAAIGGAEFGAMMTARAATDWRVPEAHEFIDNAVLIFGLRAAREYGVPALMRIYERTGKTPEEVAADSARESGIAQDVLKGRVPDAYKALEIEPRGEVRPEVTPRPLMKDPSPEAADRAAHNLRHFGDERAMKATIESEGASFLADIEGARRGTVSKAETLARAEQSAAWLRDTLGEGKATREVGDPAGDAKIVGYARVLTALDANLTDAAAKHLALKRDKASPEEITLARAEYARIEGQYRMVVADYLGAAAELGRALRAIRYIKDAVGDVKALQEAFNHAGGERGLDFRAGMIAEMKSNREKANFLRHATKFDAVVEFWKASVLSGLTDDVKNFMSNSLTAAFRVPRTFAAAMISEARGKDTVMYREAFGEMTGLVMGLAEGFRSGGRVIHNAYFGEKPIAAPGVEIHKSATESKIIHTPFIMLEAGDAVAKTVNGYATAYRAASRESKGDISKLLSNEFWVKELAGLGLKPDKPLAPGETATPKQLSTIEQMQHDALRYSFQTELGPKAKRVLGALYDTPLKYVLPFVLPFVRTPVNIYGEAVRMMPGLAVLSGRGRDAWNKGGAAREQMVADQMIGGALALTAIALAEANLLSGSGPVDPRERAALLERKWQPHSIRVGNSWYSYAGIEPFATLIGVAVDLWNAKNYMTKGEYEISARALGLAMRSQVTNKTWLMGASNLISLATPTEYGGAKVSQVAAGIVGGFIPNILGQVDKELDAHLRDTRGFVDTIQNRIPMLRRGLIPRRDSFGDTLDTNTLFPFSGVRVTRETGDPVREELARIGYAPETLRTQKVDVVPGPFKGEVEISPEQLDSLRTRAGQVAHVALEQVMRSPGYISAPLEYKRWAVEQIFSQARAAAQNNAIPVQQLQEAARKAVEKSSAVK